MASLMVSGTPTAVPEDWPKLDRQPAAPPPVEQCLHVEGQALVVDVLGRVGQRTALVGRRREGRCGSDRLWLLLSVHGAHLGFGLLSSIDAAQRVRMR